MSQHFQHDVLVIGSGAAGLSLALTLPSHMRIAVLSKGDLANGSTFWAQGGVAAVLDDTDTVQSHVEDTLNAGGGLCHEDAVRFTVEHSREAIQWLIDQGVPFTRDDTVDPEQPGFEFHLTREGGHSHRRGDFQDIALTGPPAPQYRTARTARCRRSDYRTPPGPGR